jgi:hypothetical protein
MRGTKGAQYIVIPKVLLISCRRLFLKFYELDIEPVFFIEV